MDAWFDSLSVDSRKKSVSCWAAPTSSRHEVKKSQSKFANGGDLRISRRKTHIKLFCPDRQSACNPLSMILLISSWMRALCYFYGEIFWICRSRVYLSPHELPASFSRSPSTQLVANETSFVRVAPYVTGCSKKFISPKFPVKILLKRHSVVSCEQWCYIWNSGTFAIRGTISILTLKGFRCPVGHMSTRGNGVNDGGGRTLKFQMLSISKP